MRKKPTTEDLYIQVGRRIARARKAADLSQTELADRCGLSRGSVANIETGVQRARLHTIWTIGEALERDPRSLLPEPEAISEDRVRQVHVDIKRLNVSDQDRAKVARFIAKKG